MTAALLPGAAAAQSARSYDIPAGSLADALNRYADESGVRLVYDAALASDRASPGLKGSFTPLQALSQLLDGTGLVARATGANAYTLDRAPEAGNGSVALGAVRVQGAQDDDGSTAAYESLTSDPAATEGTGSYAAQAITIMKSAVSQRETPLTVSVITNQRLEDQNLFDLRDALAMAPGISISRTGEDTVFYSRGYSVNTQVDGVPMTASSRGNRFDTAIYDRVEVLRGPAGVLNGVGSIGGSINLVRKRPTKEVSISGAASYGSWNNFRLEGDVGGPINASGTIRARAVVAFQDRDYFYDYVHSRQFTNYGVVEFDLGENTVLGATLSYTSRDRRGQYYGIPEALTRKVPRSTYPGVDWTGANSETWEAGVDLTHDFGGGWNGTVRLIRRQTTFDYAYLVPLGSPATPESFTIFLAYLPQGQDTNYGVDASISGPLRLLGGDHFLTFGGNFDRSSTLFDSPSSVVFGNAIAPDVARPSFAAADDFTNYRVDQWAPYAQGRFDLIEGVTLTAGARLSQYRQRYRYLRSAGDTDYTDYGKQNGKVTPYAGLSWDVTKGVTLYASYADIFNPQTLTAFGGEPLPPVIGWQGEGGVKASLFGDALNASLSYYRIREANRALNDPDPTHVNCGYSGGTCYVATGLILSQGVDFEVAGSPLKGLQLQGSYTYNHNEYLSDYYSKAGDIYVSSTPQHQFKLWADYQFGRMQRQDAGRFSIGGGMVAQSRISFGSDNPYGQKAYAVFNGQIGARPTENTRVTLTVNNIFDKKYLESVSSYNFYGEPRSVMLALRFGR